MTFPCPPPHSDWVILHFKEPTPGTVNNEGTPRCFKKELPLHSCRRDAPVREAPPWQRRSFLANFHSFDWIIQRPLPLMKAPSVPPLCRSSAFYTLFKQGCPSVLCNPSAPHVANQVFIIKPCLSYFFRPVAFICCLTATMWSFHQSPK